MLNKHHSISVLDCENTFACRDGTTVFHALVHKKAGGMINGCRGGGCGVCKIEVLSGDYDVSGVMSRAHVSAEDAAAGTVLACRISPKSDLVIRLRGKLKPSSVSHYTGQPLT